MDDKSLKCGVMYLLLLACFVTIYAEEDLDSNVPDLIDAPYTEHHDTWYYTEMYTNQNLQGWYAMPVGNWQIPHKSQIYDVCLSYFYIVYLTEELPTSLGEEEKELKACIIREDISPNCILDLTVKIRICDGRIQYYLPALTWGYPWTPYCFVPSDHEFILAGLFVKIKPELKYRTETIGEVQENIPYLQFNCIPEVNETMPLEVNWYVENILVKHSGPTEVLEDLVLLESDIEPAASLGFEVQCGVINVLESDSNEMLSDVFYAGWKVPDSISLTKTGFALIDVEQKTPIGCRYTGSDTTHCYQELVFEDPLNNPEMCTGGIRVQDAENASQSSIIVPMQTQEEEWQSKTFKAKLSTEDHDYEDPQQFDLEISLTDVLGVVHIDVKDNNIHKNKRCYSHVDPHHMTSDGVHFEMQKPGDHMMYLNSAFQSEIQQSARYCRAGRTSGPVCACGIAIRVGADAFVIDRCPDRSLTFDFVQCGEGGIIDIERVHDYFYKVRTPTGTVVDIFLLGGNTMNIDIYMSAKDFGNVVGLCGKFDGDGSNDLLHRDGETVSYDINQNYLFSDSWILTNEENLFTNNNRTLEPWTVFSAKESNAACTPPTSITRKKCDVPRRSKRSLSKRHVMEEEMPHVEFRTKRGEESFTEDEALAICNDTIYTAPAVLEFLDMLAGEDLNMVVQQCVYDLTIGNDTDWVAAHRDALNKAAETILKFNPTYVANNTEAVRSFLSNTCLNNCSQNGLCTETGLCECTGVFRGPDCSIDINIPPVVLEIQGGDFCDTRSGDDCTCFVIRTDSIFEGFKCSMSKYKVYINGTKVMKSSNTFEGNYHDIFTGVCCDPSYRKKRSVDDSDTQITLYEISVSNDGSNFGETRSVYVYDTTCLQHDEVDGTITFFISDGFCFIGGTCILHRSKDSSADGCYFCDATVDQYKWSEGICDERKDAGLQIATIVGIIVGLVIIVTLVTVVPYLLYKNITKKQRTIADSQDNLQDSQDNLNDSQDNLQSSKTKMDVFQLYNTHRLDDNSILEHDSVQTASRRMFHLNSKHRDAWPAITISQHNIMSTDDEKKRSYDKQIKDGKLHLFGANRDFEETFCEAGSPRRKVNQIGGNSMESVELF